jgi:hypothetical protein
VAELTIVLVTVVLATLVLTLVREPARVGHIDIVNPSTAPIDVTVAAASGGPTLALGQALPHSRLHVDGVLDQGERWVFSYRTATCAPQEQAVGRNALDGGWTVTVPDRIAGAFSRGCVYRSPLP